MGWVIASRCSEAADGLCQSTARRVQLTLHLAEFTDDLVVVGRVGDQAANPHDHVVETECNGSECAGVEGHESGSFDRDGGELKQGPEDGDGTVPSGSC